MKRLQWLAAVVAATVLVGCTSTTDPAPEMLLDQASQNVAFQPLSLTAENGHPDQKANFNVQTVNVTVPAHLQVSEANRYYPPGDIVWRGDPPGDRHMQVKSIFETAATRGTADLRSGQSVIVDIEVERFHGLTEKTRYTVGGVHSIRFNMALRDAETGHALGAPQTIKADLKGYGGKRAIEADRQGLTQKVRVTNHLSAVIAAHLGGSALQKSALVELDERSKSEF